MLIISYIIHMREEIQFSNALNGWFAKQKFISKKYCDEFLRLRLRLAQPSRDLFVEIR